MTSYFIIPDEVRVKILMFGRGVIATVYGWALEQAGHVIEFYVRPGRASAYGEAVDLDLIVLSVPHHRLAEAAAFLAPRVGNATVLVFGNIWAEPLAAIGALPVDQ